MNELLLKQILARNLVYYRKRSGMTQAELAEKINYSDKSVSKWERGDGLPDVYVLTLLAALYGVTLDHLVQEDMPEAPPLAPQKQKVIIPTMAVALVWLFASVVFLALRVIFPGFEKAWLAFLLAVPASCIVTVVFSKLWWNLLLLCISVSALVWSVAISMVLLVRVANIQALFVVAAILQILTVLWYLLKHNPRKRGQ